jgi:hypothetical protein
LMEVITQTPSTIMWRQLATASVVLHTIVRRR